MPAATYARGASDAVQVAVCVAFCPSVCACRRLHKKWQAKAYHSVTIVHRLACASAWLCPGRPHCRRLQWWRASFCPLRNLRGGERSLVQASTQHGGGEGRCTSGQCSSRRTTPSKKFVMIVAGFIVSNHTHEDNPRLFGDVEWLR